MLNHSYKNILDLNQQFDRIALGLRFNLCVFFFRFDVGSCHFFLLGNFIRFASLFLITITMFAPVFIT